MLRLPHLFFILLLVSFKSSYSQSKKTGNWGIITINLPSTEKHRWGGYFESQVRTDKILFNHLYYYELKTGVSYAITKNMIALLGTGRYTTYDYQDLSDGPTIEETRIWQQLIFTHLIDRVKFEHRGRIEQRWLNEVYRNRYRYRLNVTVPINHPKLIANTVFVSAFNEIFLNNRHPNFERNRITGTLGYQFTKAFSMQTGWLYQYNNTLNGTNAKYNLTLNMTYSIQR
jgi:hypothetical protein